MGQGKSHFSEWCSIVTVETDKAVLRLSRQPI